MVDGEKTRKLRENMVSEFSEILNSWSETYSYSDGDWFDFMAACKSFLDFQKSVDFNSKYKRMEISLEDYLLCSLKHFNLKELLVALRLEKKEYIEIENHKKLLNKNLLELKEDIFNHKYSELAKDLQKNSFSSSFFSKENDSKIESLQKIFVKLIRDGKFTRDLKNGFSYHTNAIGKFEESKRKNLIKSCFLMRLPLDQSNSFLKKYNGQKELYLLEPKEFIYSLILRLNGENGSFISFEEAEKKANKFDFLIKTKMETYFENVDLESKTYIKELQELIGNDGLPSIDAMSETINKIGNETIKGKRGLKPSSSKLYLFEKLLSKEQERIRLSQEKDVKREFSITEYVGEQAEDIIIKYFNEISEDEVSNGVEFITNKLFKDPTNFERLFFYNRFRQLQKVKNLLQSYFDKIDLYEENLAVSFNWLNKNKEENFSTNFKAFLYAISPTGYHSCFVKIKRKSEMLKRFSLNDRTSKRMFSFANIPTNSDDFDNEVPHSLLKKYEMDKSLNRDVFPKLGELSLGYSRKYLILLTIFCSLDLVDMRRRINDNLDCFGFEELNPRNQFDLRLLFFLECRSHFLIINDDDDKQDGMDTLYKTLGYIHIFNCLLEGELIVYSSVHSTEGFEVYIDSDNFVNFIPIEKKEVEHNRNLETKNGEEKNLNKEWTYINIDKLMTFY